MESPKSGSLSPKLVVKHTFLEVDEAETDVSHEKPTQQLQRHRELQDMIQNSSNAKASSTNEEPKEPSSPALSGTSSSLAWRNRQEDNPVRLVVKHTFIEVDGQANPKDPSVKQRRSSCSDIGANNALRYMPDQSGAWNGIQEDSEDDEDQVGPKESMRSWTTATAFDSQSNFGEPGSNYGEYRDLRYSGSRRSSRTDFVPSLSPINCSNPENPGLPRKVELTSISAGLDLSPMSGKSSGRHQYPLAGSPPVVGSPITGSPIAGASFGFGCNDGGSARIFSESGSQMMSPQQSGGATLEDISAQPSSGYDSSRTRDTPGPSPGRSSRRNSGKMSVASFQNQADQTEDLNLPRVPMMPGCGGCCCCCGGYAGPYACSGGMTPQSSYPGPCDNSGAFAYQPIDAARNYPSSPTRYAGGGAGDRDPRAREMPPPMMYPPVTSSYPTMSTPGQLPPPHPYAMPPPGYMGGLPPPTLGTWPQGPMPPNPYMQNLYGPPAGPHGLPDAARHNPLALRPNNGSPASRDAYADPRGTVPTPCGSGSIPAGRGGSNNFHSNNINGSNFHGGSSHGGSPAGSSPATVGSPTTGKQIAPELRTTVMLRNIPEGYLRENLAKLLDSSGFQKQYDFLYLPMNFRTAAPIGYAFVNFVAPRHAQRCFEIFEGFCDWGVSTSKICEPAWSEGSQGLPEHIDRYRNCPLMHESVPDQYKPAVYSNGARVPFPEPTQQVRRPRLRRVEGEDGSAQAV
eukprot:CAMPEP_0206442182 /NCGR_PEP_ID=MMETSP0324_2-20121206/13681_1 /ASSEMBLY_ACC=CAM_ASM_000836 /TAXON_ID=2866 /ORGANISM="Crypthecodinium cohnii, Strain Seligo" /LENGTH=739 /DNA_ID=CAMNT_0053909999 /DNA_START=400 /DNA_END=2620 /DNA_ORIENTATION=-